MLIKYANYNSLASIKNCSCLVQSSAEQTKTNGDDTEYNKVWSVNKLVVHLPKSLFQKCQTHSVQHYQS